MLIAGLLAPRLRMLVRCVDVGQLFQFLARLENYRAIHGRLGKLEFPLRTPNPSSYTSCSQALQMLHDVY